MQEMREEEMNQTHSISGVGFSALLHMVPVRWIVCGLCSVLYQPGNI